MPTRRQALATTLALVVLGGCSRDDPQAALEAAVQQLQDSLEAKRTSAVMDLLDAQFRVQQEPGREWAQRTMTLMFLRHASVKVVAVTRSSRIDPNARHVGYTDAQVVLAGAQGLIPEQAAPYSIRLQWRRDGNRWKLFALEWE